MKITVIGGSGFLGSHVADQLSSEGHEVLIFDRKKSQWLRDDQKVIIGDLLDLDCLEEAIKDAEIVFHFAALSDLNEALNKPIETVKINILGTVQILEVCRKYKIKRFMYASSIYVFSSEGGFYRCSKQSSEHYIEEYFKTYDLEYTILRYGSLYGPRSDESNGLYRIVKNALNTKKLTISKLHPEAKREYIHVEDAARASVNLISDEFKNQSVILTGSELMNVTDMLKMLAEILKIPYEIDFLDENKSGHYIRTPYTFQPKLGLKYSPQFHVDMGQGLLQLINEISKND